LTAQGPSPLRSGFAQSANGTSDAFSQTVSSPATTEPLLHSGTDASGEPFGGKDVLEDDEFAAFFVVGKHYRD